MNFILLHFVHLAQKTRRKSQRYVYFNTSQKICQLYAQCLIHFVFFLFFTKLGSVNLSPFLTVNI